MNLPLTESTFIIGTVFYLIVISVSYFYLRKQFDHSNKEHRFLRYVFFAALVLIASSAIIRLTALGTIQVPPVVNGIFLALTIITLPLVAGMTFCFISHTMAKTGYYCLYAVSMINIVNIVLLIISFIPGTNIYFQIVNGSYVLGHLISVFFILALLLYLAAVVVVLRNWIRVGKRESAILLTLVLLPSIGAIMQIHPKLYFFPLTIMGITLSFLVLAMNLQHTNATTDFLTGLYNRRSLTLALRKKINSMRREEKFTVFMLDIDGFKKINDTHGHIVGDNVLRELSEYLRTVRRAGDLVFRFGGDEFVIISSVEDEKEIKEYIEFIREHIKNYSPRLTKDIPLDFSVGFTIYNRSSEKSAIDILIEIDDYMYRDKRLRAKNKN